MVKLRIRKENLYNTFKPYVGKLFSYIILLVIAFNGWKLYLENLTSYLDFLTNLKDPLIIDIIFMNITQSCPAGYDDIRPAIFKQTFKGCICDGNIMKASNCELLMRNSNVTTKCTTADLTKKQLDYLKCGKCYTKIDALPNNITMQFYYDIYRPCLLRDTTQNTINYLQSAQTECDPQNVCDDYFCKLNNDNTKKCPITIIFKNHTPVMGYNGLYKNETGPFKFSDSYRKYFNYDIANHGYVYPPITDIASSLQGVCDSVDSRYTSNYPLIKITSCQTSSLYDTFDFKNITEILRNNNIDKVLFSALPRYSTDSSKEFWLISSKTAFQKNTLYCIINKYALSVSNLFNVLSNQTSPVAASRKKLFIDQIYVFTHIENNSYFQGVVQRTMLYVTLFVTSLEALAVLVKTTDSCGVNLKFLIKIFSYEGYIAFTIDVFMAILGLVISNTLTAFIHQLKKILDTNCLDESSFGKLINYKVAGEVVSDKSFEIFIIVLVKLLLVIISVVYACFIKKGKLPYSEFAELVCEVKEEEQKDEKEKAEGKDYVKEKVKEEEKDEKK